MLLHQLYFILDTQANKNGLLVFYASYANFLLCRASVEKKSYVIKTQEHLDTEVTDSQRLEWHSFHFIVINAPWQSDSLVMRKGQKTTCNGQNLIRFKITASAFVSTNMAKTKNKLQIGARNIKCTILLKEMNRFETS